MLFAPLTDRTDDDPVAVANFDGKRTTFGVPEVKLAQYFEFKQSLAGQLIYTMTIAAGKTPY